MDFRVSAPVLRHHRQGRALPVRAGSAGRVPAARRSPGRRIGLAAARDRDEKWAGRNRSRLIPGSEKEMTYPMNDQPLPISRRSLIKSGLAVAAAGITLPLW